jgi:hypothetical protein
MRLYYKKKHHYRFRLMVFNTTFNNISVISLYSRGGCRGERTRRAPPLKLEKNMFFWRKIVIFYTKYPNIFRASLRNCKNYDFLA